MRLNRCEHVRARAPLDVRLLLFLFAFLDIMRLHTLINRWKVGVLNSDGRFSTDFNQRFFFFSFFSFLFCFLTRSKWSNEVFQKATSINELKLYYYSMNRHNYFITLKTMKCRVGLFIAWTDDRWLCCCI